MQYNQVNNIHVFLGTFVDKSYHILLPLFFSTFMLLTIVGCSEVALSPEQVVIDTNSSGLRILVMEMPEADSDLNNEVFNLPIPIDEYYSNLPDVVIPLQLENIDSGWGNELVIGGDLLDMLVETSQESGIACTNTSRGPFGAITYSLLSQNAQETVEETGSCGQGTCVGPMEGPGCPSVMYDVCVLIVISADDGFVSTNGCSE